MLAAHTMTIVMLKGASRKSFDVSCNWDVDICSVTTTKLSLSSLLNSNYVRANNDHMFLSAHGTRKDKKYLMKFLTTKYQFDLQNPARIHLFKIGYLFLTTYPLVLSI